MEEENEEGEKIVKPKIEPPFKFKWHINKKGFLKNIKQINIEFNKFQP